MAICDMNIMKWNVWETIKTMQTPSLLSPCGTYQIDYYPIRGIKSRVLKIGTFEGCTEFKETVTIGTMENDIQSRVKFRGFKKIRLNKIPQLP